VFQVTKAELEKGRHHFERSQRFQDFTTRKHYAGEHRIAILVNGEEKAITKFQLTS
jgi:hypothetical protein